MQTLIQTLNSMANFCHRSNLTQGSDEQLGGVNQQINVDGWGGFIRQTGLITHQLGAGRGKIRSKKHSLVNTIESQTLTETRLTCPEVSTMAIGQKVLTPIQSTTLSPTHKNVREDHQGEVNIPRLTLHNIIRSVYGNWQPQSRVVSCSNPTLQQRLCLQQTKLFKKEDPWKGLLCHDMTNSIPQHLCEKRNTAIKTSPSTKTYLTYKKKVLP